MEETHVDKPDDGKRIVSVESDGHEEMDTAEPGSEMEIEIHVDGDNKVENSAMRDSIIIDESEPREGEEDPPIGKPTATEGDSNLEPYVGMRFKNREVAHVFYVEYAKRTGFRTVKKFTRRSRRTGMFIAVAYVCSRNGFRKPRGKARNQEATSYTGCKAMMKLKRMEGKWVVNEVIKEHNHELGPEPERKPEPDSDPDGGVVRNTDGFDNNGKEQKKPLVFGEDDVEAVSEFFIHMQLLHPTFIYGVDLDEEQYLRNIFWADPKCRLDYNHFGDVVTFDTAYLTNKYHMPLATFVGANHHGQPVLFGCALITDEVMSAFVWAFKTWLKAMSGKPPNAIITTSHDKVIKAAISEVFPEARHRYCLGHSLKKVPEELADVCKAHDNFMKKFEKCVYDSVAVDEFETRWRKLIAKFELMEREWPQALYEDRQQWVPAYLKDTFFAGMSVSHRNDSVSSVFDAYVTKKTTLKEFIEQYETALHNRCEKEAQADFETFYKKPSMRTPSPFEAQLASVYTKDIFKKFQIEVVGIVACHTISVRQDGATAMYTVKDLETKKDYIVMWNGYEAKVSCVCHLFEFKGYLCRHVMTVFVASGLYEIPSHYILKRWTKDAKCVDTLDQVCGGLQDDGPKSTIQRSNFLYQQSMKLAEEGSLSKEGYVVALRALQEALEKVVLENESLGRLIHQRTLPSNDHYNQVKETRMRLFQDSRSQSHYIQGVGQIGSGSMEFRQPVQHTTELATNGTVQHGNIGFFQSGWQSRQQY